MSSVLPHEAVISRIDELERELVSLRTFFAPGSDTSANDAEATADASRPEIAEDRTRPRANIGDEERELLLCRAGDIRVALPLVQVREVVPVARLLPLPGASECVLGSLDLHGEPVVIHDMVQHLSGVRDPIERTHLILVVSVDDGVIGIKVTDAVDVIRASVRGVSSSSALEVRSDIVLGVSIHDGAQVMVMDVEAIAMRSQLAQVPA